MTKSKDQVEFDCKHEVVHFFYSVAVFKANHITYVVNTIESSTEPQGVLFCSTLFYTTL